MVNETQLERMNDEDKRSRRRKGNPVVEGLLLGAVAAGALYLGSKQCKEDSKLADTLLEVAQAEDGDFTQRIDQDLKLRDLPDSFFDSSVSSTSTLRDSGLSLIASVLSRDPLWKYIFQKEDDEIRTSILRLFTHVHTRGNMKNGPSLTKAILTRRHRTLSKKNENLQISVLLTLLNVNGVSKADPILSSNISGTSLEARDRLAEFGRFMSLRKSRLCSTHPELIGNQYIELTRLVINDAVEISKDMIMKNLTRSLRKLYPNRKFLTCVYSSADKALLEDLGFHVLDEVRYPVQANSQTRTDQKEVNNFAFTCHFLIL
mmetsp:Transcript_3456/g.3942  ORF Transcript_3456/g.3942 Transcript_3456/m.3942 type:complete len:318 (+) Transcript_3456:130-1083(+)